MKYHDSKPTNVPHHYNISQLDNKCKYKIIIYWIIFQ